MQGAFDFRYLSIYPPVTELRHPAPFMDHRRRVVIMAPMLGSLDACEALSPLGAEVDTNHPIMHELAWDVVNCLAPDITPHEESSFKHEA